MDHVMPNLGNINYKPELEMKVSLLGIIFVRFLIDKLLIIKKLKTDSKSNLFPTDVSTTTNTITTPAQTNDNVNSNNDNNNKNNINDSHCKNKNNDNNSIKNKKNNNSTNCSGTI